MSGRDHKPGFMASYAIDQVYSLSGFQVFLIKSCYIRMCFLLRSNFSLPKKASHVFDYLVSVYLSKVLINQVKTRLKHQTRTYFGTNIDKNVSLEKNYPSRFPESITHFYEFSPLLFLSFSSPESAIITRNSAHSLWMILIGYSVSNKHETLFCDG